MAISAAGGFGWAVSRRCYAAPSGVVESAAAIELRQNGHHTLHRKILRVSHPVALALFSTASTAAEAAAALHALGISREHISVVAHSHADARTLAERMDATPGVDLEDSRPAALLGELGGRMMAAIALVMPGIGPIVAAGPLAAGAWGSGGTRGRQPCVGSQVRRFATGACRGPATRGYARRGAVGRPRRAARR